ncbi:arsenite efflux transporter metallochaperone ArsD [Natronomonas gomsonensis]|uniref:arsenite efflux transporter metallochaperone ArsD n=1 Tax=Natronomonas gomsonensis TaxID=1046043 RepID=UPI00227A785E|nr:arsenite efflux transporter metallochaperone ArsD [Natronomonas gomsonensis]MCY4732973.1 arsenite efflux transporter metallochaperone ArsD [Natronomonas gomsonensis]
MTELTLYEEAMCCSTGVCGPDPDDELVEVSAALDQLEAARDDLEIARANMQHDMDQFLETQPIYDLVEEHGPSILPITVVDDEVVAEGEYLGYDELEAVLEDGVDARPTEA